MPHYRAEWLKYIQKVGVEYRSAKVAIDHVNGRLRDDANYLHGELDRERIALVRENLEGTYLVRVVAAFEAALRSYEHWWHHERVGKVWVGLAQMINEIGHRSHDDVPRRRKREIGLQIRERARQVLRSRHVWAHDDAAAIEVPVPIERAQECLLEYIQKMPIEWG